MPADQFLMLVARILLASAFLRVGASKVGDLGSFRRVVADFAILPSALIPATAVAVAWSEVTAGALLLVGVATRAVAVAVAALLSAFTAAVAVNLVRGRRIACGCSGSRARPISWIHVVTNLALIALAGTLAARPPATLSLWPGGESPPSASPSPAHLFPPLIVLVLTVATGVTLVTTAVAVRRRAAQVRRPGAVTGERSE